MSFLKFSPFSPSEPIEITIVIIVIIVIITMINTIIIITTIIFKVWSNNSRHFVDQQGFMRGLFNTLEPLVKQRKLKYHPLLLASNSFYTEFKYTNTKIQKCKNTKNTKMQKYKNTKIQKIQKGKNTSLQFLGAAHNSKNHPALPKSNF